MQRGSVEARDGEKESERVSMRRAKKGGYDGARRKKTSHQLKDFWCQTVEEEEEKEESEDVVVVSGPIPASISSENQKVCDEVLQKRTTKKKTTKEKTTKEKITEEKITEEKGGYDSPVPRKKR